MAPGLPDQCCTLPPFKSDYEPVGKHLALKSRDGTELDIYVTGRAETTVALVCVYDIFGFHNNTFQGADHLARECGYTIVMPDFFRGRGWKTDNIPPKEGRDAMQAYIQSIGSWEILRPDFLQVVEHLKSEGKTSIGAYGFCFGGKKLAQAAAAGEDLFKSVALVHPTSLDPGDGNIFSVPVALIPSAGEDQAVMNAIWETLQQKPFAQQCVRKDFLDAHHGFASARSNWNDPELAAKANAAHEVMANFFKATL